MKNRHYMVSALMLACLLTGCDGKTSAKAPELVEPKTSEIIYEEAILRDVGETENDNDIRNYVANVIPREYPQFFNKSVAIEDIVVKVGDEVKAGDVLAIVNTDSINNRISDLKAEIQYREGLFLLENNKYEFDHKAREWEYDLKLQNMWENHDNYTDKQTEGVNGYLKDFEEQHTNDVLLHNFNISYLNSEIAECNKQLENTKLIADHDGIVTYVKDLNSTSDAGSEENVVVISDFDEVVIELPGATVHDKIFSRTDDCYCYIDDVKYKVREDVYSDIETRVMQSKKKYANVRVIVDGYENKFKPGDCFQVTFRNNYANDVLSIHKDSLFNDENGSFVYLQGSKSDEKRYVEVGNTDKYYAEIKSGIESGELVRREINPLQKSEEDKIIKASLRDVSTNRWSVRDYDEKKYFAKRSGIVDSVNYEESYEVEENGAVVSIRQMDSKTQLVELNNQLEQLEVNFNSEINGLNEQIEEYNKSLEKDVLPQLEEVCEAFGAVSRAGMDASELYEAQRRMLETRDMYNAWIESANLEKQILAYKLDYEKKVASTNLARASENINSDGNYDVSIEKAGTIGKMEVRPGNSVKIGDNLFTLRIPGRKRIIVYSNENTAIGQKMVFKKDLVEYEGVVTGMVSRNTPKVYITAKDDKVYLTTDMNLSSDNGYVVELESDEMYDALNREFACIMKVFKLEERPVSNEAGGLTW